MDFVSDALFNGKRIRALTVVDNFTRRCLAIEVDCSLRGDQVVGVLERLLKDQGPPKCIRVDNGREFVSKVLDHWAYRNGVVLDFSRPGKPIDNCYVESFNGRFRDECLNTHWFLLIEDARAKIEAWRLDYNASRPHSALGQLTPLEALGLIGPGTGRGSTTPEALGLIGPGTGKGSEAQRLRSPRSQTSREMEGEQPPM
jgi:putative transposase